jgi:hypothetical protein
MTSRKAQREQLDKSMIVLPNIKGRNMSKEERDDYFKFIRMERKRLGKNPSANVIAALHQADTLLKKAELESKTKYNHLHPSKEDIESAMNESESTLSESESTLSESESTKDKSK